MNLPLPTTYRFILDVKVLQMVFVNFLITLNKVFIASINLKFF